MNYTDTIDADVFAMMGEALGDDFAEIIELFVQHAPGQISDLRSAVVAGDAQARCQVAHALKGSSSNLGAARFSSLCHDLERVEEQEEQTTAIELLNKLEDEFPALLVALSEGL